MMGAQEHANTAYEWWRRLTAKEGAGLGQRRAALARMRRAATPIEVMQEPEVLRLIERLPRRPEDVAILAGILGFVRESDDRSVARAVGRTRLDDDQSARLSEGRFRRLLQAQHGELMEALRRLVRMTKGKADVRDLSASVLYWGDGVKKRWIFDYYAVRQSLPSDEDAPVTPASTSPEQQEPANG
ncbi:MAG: type I-E CRISPR-associated protein Cse2/CasB [Acidobacteria bacterium]|nr:type I-E CRISPR-associated protein Cse2/CasB [Acidobacteriota bacterium]